MQTAKPQESFEEAWNILGYWQMTTRGSFLTSRPSSWEKKSASGTLMACYCNIVITIW